MPWFALAKGIIGRMVGWGAIGGAAAGGLYGFLVQAIWGSNGYMIGVALFVGFLYGGSVGLILGLIDGSLLSCMARRRFALAHNRIIINLVITAATGAGAFLGFGGTSGTSLVGSSPTAVVLYTLIPTVIASGLAWVASSSVVKWVAQSTENHHFNV